MAFQMELARANGDVKRAQSIGTKITSNGGTGGTTPELALQMAFLALDQKQYDQAAKTIEGASASFNEPEQQAEALYCLAEAKAATAKDEASLRDAALAYMRVVARAKTARLNSPRVPDALLKTAAIEEKLGAAKEALLLYQQVADEFKGTDAARSAADGVNRLGKSAAAQ